MSDILIKGMEMLKDDCEAYRQIIITNNLVDGKIQMLAHDANTNEFIGEVVELPPHGRLIDEDVLIKTANNQKPLPIDFLKLLELVPTVIPAEPGEEET